MCLRLKGNLTTQLRWVETEQLLGAGNVGLEPAGVGVGVGEEGAGSRAYRVKAGGIKQDRESEGCWRGSVWGDVRLRPAGRLAVWMMEAEGWNPAEGKDGRGELGFTGRKGRDWWVHGKEERNLSSGCSGGWRKQMVLTWVRTQDQEQVLV